MFILDMSCYVTACWMYFNCTVYVYTKMYFNCTVYVYTNIYTLFDQMRK